MKKLARAEGTVGLDCDGAPSGNWAMLDTASMRWLRFHGKPIRNAVRSLVAG